MAIYYVGDNPCKGCEKREQACHSRCKDYEAWKSSAVEKRFIMWTTPAHERYRKRARSRNKQD